MSPLVSLRKKQILNVKVKITCFDTVTHVCLLNVYIENVSLWKIFTFIVTSYYIAFTRQLWEYLFKLNISVESDFQGGGDSVL